MAGSDLEVAKEHVEGVMQGLDRYPNAGLESVGTYGPGASRSGPARFADIVGKEAYALSDSETILFNNRFGGDGASYRQLLAHETGGHIGQLARDPRGVGLHEFGHVMAERHHGTTDHVAEHVAGHAHATGANSKDFATAHISRYGASDPHELAAEVFADVMINGANASAVSKSAFDIITGSGARSFVRHLPGKHNQKDHGRRGGVRASLNKAKTTDEVAAVISQEASALVGDHVAVSMEGADVQVARQFGEGILQGAEKYPATPLRVVGTYGHGGAASGHNETLLQHDAHSANARAIAIRGGEGNGAGGIYHAPDARMPNGHSTAGSAIYLNVKNATPASFAASERIRELEIKGVLSGRGIVSKSPRETALHEFGHSIGKHGRPGMPEYQVGQAARRRAASEGVDVKTLVGRGVSHYAGTDDAELSAEVFADVMANGSKATALSKDLFAVFDANVRGWEALVTP